MNALTGQFSDPVEQISSEQIESFLSPGENASEGEKLAKLCGGDVTRLSVEPGRFVQALYDLGEVMALTGNDSAVHRKHGVYDNVHVNRMHTIVLNRDIDLRIFMKQWTNTFSVILASPSPSPVSGAHLNPAMAWISRNRGVPSMGTGRSSRGHLPLLR